MFGDLSVENKPEGVGKTIKFEIGPKQRLKLNKLSFINEENNKILV
jgi:hypothetical protein